MANRPTTSSSIYMANLEFGMDEQFVRKLFEDQGENVVYVRVIRKTRQEGSCYAYCFVDFGSKDIATRVLRQYNNKPIPGMENKRFRLNHCQGRGDSQSVSRPEFSIFVGDLTSEVDDLMLHDFFAERFQDVKAAKVVLDEQGVPKGFGFVRFYNEDERNKAAVDMQGAAGLGGKTLKISVATPKSRAFEHGKQPSTASSSYGFGNNQYQQQPYSGPWNQQWQQYYNSQGGDGSSEWSATNYEQYYNYQAQTDTSDQSVSASTDTAKDQPATDVDIDAFDMEHGQEATDMKPIDKDIMKHCSGELYQAMQRSRWHPVDSYSYIVGQ